jgi:phosphonatase-like hydrolase
VLLLLRARGYAEQATAIHEAFVARLCDHFRLHAREVAGASDALAKLRSSGLRVVLDTALPRRVTDAILSKLRWTERGLVNAVITGDDVADVRPAPDAIFRAMRLTGMMHVQRVAKVGDAAADLEQGSAAGCGLVIGVLDGASRAEQLKRHPHTHLVRTVADVPPLLRWEASAAAHVA